MIRLEVLNTAFKGKQFKFKEGLAIGSGTDCQIRAQHEGLRELHARFYSEDGKPMVEIGCDEAHLYVNGRDVVRSQIKHQDMLQIGPLKLRVVDDTMVSNPGMNLDKLLADYEQGRANEVYDFSKEDLFYLVTKEPALRQAISFSIPSRDRFIDQAQSFLSRMAKQSGMEEMKLEGFMTCTKELILNAHRHGHKYDESKTILVRYRDLGDSLQVVISDQGTGFDHRTVLEGIRAKDAAQAARERYQAGGFGGLGFKLITQMSDQLVYNDAGTEVTFSVNKKRPE